MPPLAGTIMKSPSMSSQFVPLREKPKQTVVLKIRGGGIKNAKKDASIEKSTGGSSTTASVFNLVNNVAGAGILTLAGGKASGTGYIPALIICVGLSLLSAHTFSLIGTACEMTGEKTFAGLWKRAFGPKSAAVVPLIVSLQGTSSQIIYSGMLGDVFTALFKMYGVPDNLNSRTTNIFVITGMLLYPLCSLRNLSALAFTSVLGFSAVMYSVLFMVVRSLDGSYSLDPPGKFIGDNAIVLPVFDKSSLWHVDFKSLVLVSNLGLAYIAHYNAPSYFKELKGATSKSFTKMVMIAYATLSCIYVLAMMAGYSTFGDICQGNILLNYHPKDILSTLARWATGFSIIFGFPLVNNGAREGLKQLFSEAFGIKALSDPNNHIMLVSVYLAIVTLISVSVTDVKLLVGLAGAAFGSFLVYICPTLVYTKIVKDVSGPESIEYKRAKRNFVLIPFGLFCGGMGVSMTILEALKRAGKM
eukprot:CAMPEP_0195519780 /NCGR_PEP_ID=MMETSP0794_2-20130614/15463_1 /TAXON_ID=515487 /ORGANISM="Stephanopyxis turris, Strain CCMP 815" /LENGTH=472 /DNA_ID=CAMNT_0040648993 /DNA_START=162 /DNA_END=1580 /DNA_ORIENTATION=+